MKKKKLRKLVSKLGRNPSRNHLEHLMRKGLIYDFSYIPCRLPVFVTLPKKGGFLRLREEGWYFSPPCWKEDAVLILEDKHG